MSVIYSKALEQMVWFSDYTKYREHLSIDWCVYFIHPSALVSADVFKTH